MANLKKLPAVFYATRSANEPVREWLKQLDADSRRIVGEDIATAEFGWPIGMSLCREMGNRLHEIRSHMTSGRIARVLFAPIAGEMVLLHGFIKKIQKTPRPISISPANERMKAYVS